jgi:hypothetical protein
VIRDGVTVYVLWYGCRPAVLGDEAGDEEEEEPSRRGRGGCGGCASSSVRAAAPRAGVHAGEAQEVEESRAVRCRGALRSCVGWDVAGMRGCRDVWMR